MINQSKIVKIAKTAKKLCNCLVTVYNINCYKMHIIWMKFYQQKEENLKQLGNQLLHVRLQQCLVVKFVNFKELMENYIMN